MTDVNNNISRVNADTLPGTLPATEAQKEIWISSKMGHDASCAYNQSFQIGIAGMCNIEYLQQTIETVVLRHDAFNAVFSDNGMCMLLGKSAKGNVLIVDLSGMSGLEQTETLKQISVHQVSNPFDLTHGPLWRAIIVMVSLNEIQLFFSAHHIICDGWSINVVVDEILTTYSLCLQNKVPAVTQSPSFAEYLKEQNKFSGTQPAVDHKEYWKTKFKQTVQSLELPTDKPRPSQRTYNSDCVIGEIPTQLLSDIKKTAIALQCSLFTMFLGAYAILLYKLTENSPLVIGVPVSGQSFSDKNDLVGHCVNMLPIKCTINPEVTFSKYIVELQDMLYDDFDNYTVTFGELVKVLNIQRDPSRIPLVATGLTYEKIKSSGDMRFSDFSATFQINERAFETFEIYGSIFESGNECRIMWQYNTDLFCRETVMQWLNAYQTILCNAIGTPECTIRDLSMLSTNARQELLYTWNRTVKTLPTGQTIVGAIEESAEKYPDSIAVEYCGQTCTYRILENRAIMFAKVLGRMNIKPGSVVAVCMDKNIDTVIALMAILKARAVYVPIDVAFPDDRIGFIIADSGAVLLITQRAIQQKFSFVDCHVITIDDCIETNGTDGLQLKEQPLPTDPAYIIYTSGSTGKPKGVTICHGSLYNFLVSMSLTPGMRQTDSLLSVTTVSFDIAGLEIFLPLLVGARIIIAEKEIVADGVRLSRKITDYRPTIMQGTPSTWNMLLASGWNDARGMVLLCGGEAMTRTLADRLLATGAVVWNMYGPTETTIWSSLWRVEPGTNVPSIGYPIANTQLYVLDKSMQPALLGVMGELYIGGKGLAFGYHNRSELTKDKFIPDPFLDGDAAGGCGRIYNTGDLAKRLADGSIIVSGRSDFQVKVRGYRIEPGEIEAVLLTEPIIRECVVTNIFDTSGGNVLVAYVVFHPGEVLPVDLMQAALRQQLPSYMIPSLFVILPELPRLTNNKINRAALPPPSREYPALSTGYVGPVNDTERALVTIWTEVLGIQKFGTTDNFFDIGGHSLLLAELSLRIQQVFGSRVTTMSLFQFPTIASLSEYIGFEKKQDDIEQQASERANMQRKRLQRAKNRTGVIESEQR